MVLHTWDTWRTDEHADAKTIECLSEERTTPPTTMTLIDVREVRDATLVAIATTRSSWVINAVSLLGKATVDGGPEEGVEAMGSAGRPV